MLDSIFVWSALIGGAVLAFQFVMMLLGLGHHGSDLSGAHGADFSGGHLDGSHLGHADMSGHGAAAHDSFDSQIQHSHVPWFYEMLSLRTISAAATFFGLVGMTSHAYGLGGTTSFVLAGMAGFAAMYGVYWLFKQVYKLQNSGTENIRNAIGTEATVYLPIPAKRTGAGKVTFRLQNRLVEYLAVTEDESRLATGEKVVVVGVVNTGTVRVARAAAPVANMAPTA